MGRKALAAAMMVGAATTAGTAELEEEMKQCLPVEEHWEVVTEAFGRVEAIRERLNDLIVTDERYSRVEALKRGALAESDRMAKLDLEVDALVLRHELLEDFHRAVWSAPEWETFVDAMTKAQAGEVCEPAGVRLSPEQWQWRNVKHAYERVSSLRKTLAAVFEAEELKVQASSSWGETIEVCGDAGKTLLESCPTLEDIHRDGKKAIEQACPQAYAIYDQHCPARAELASLNAWMKAGETYRYLSGRDDYTDGLRDEIEAWGTLSRAMGTGNRTP